MADELWDGYMSAQQQPLRVFQALPKTASELYFCGDSACEEEALLSWLRNDQREDGPRGFIGLAVSAPMNPMLSAKILATP